MSARLGLFSSRPVSVSFPSYLIPLGALSLCVYGASRLPWKNSIFEPLDNVDESPLKTIVPKLSEEERKRLPYPLDLLPGARDVVTPFGNLRVYEWGPEDGRRVVLVHGISTPCLSLGRLAELLVENGCRIMLFDLFGRGYSDNPQDLAHDSRLYTTQILLGLASSPISWTGTNALSIIGYSLGGGIAASFTDTFPQLVAGLILIAPSGIVRLRQIAWSSKFLYQTEGILPERLIRYLVRRRLWSGTKSVPSDKDKADATSATAAELGAESETKRLYSHHPHVDATSAVQWQLENHPGFVPAFISAIRHAPITNQHESWLRIARRQSAAKFVDKGAMDFGETRNKEVQSAGLERRKVLLVLGGEDPIVKVSEVGVDAEQIFGGKEYLETAIIPGGHEIPMSHAEDVAKAILKYCDV